MEKENIKAFMLYDIDEETTFMKSIKREILIIIFSIIVIIFSMNNIIFIILGILPGVIHMISVLKLGEEGTVKGVYNILHNGIFAVCQSYILAMISLELAFHSFEKDERGLVICIMVLGYVSVILLYKHMITRNIKENVYGGEKEKIKGAPFFAIPGVLGMIAGRIFLKNIDERSAAKVVCILTLLLSFVFLIGIFNIYKYKYLMEHKELLEGLDVDIKE